MQRHTAARWEDLLDELAAWLRDLGLGVFDRVRVIVPTAAVGRLTGQALAERLGILSGVDFITPEAWLDEIQLQLGDGERSPWRGRRLQLAVWEALTDEGFIAGHRALRAHLAAGRLRATSHRLAQLMELHLTHRLDLVAAWSADPEPTGLPEHLAWLPELFVRVAEILEWDPVEEFERLRSEVGEHTGPPTALLLVPDLPATTELLLESASQEILALDLDGTAVPAEVTWLASHAPSRQAEVLRDELCHLLASDDALEPRDILVVVPDVASWWPSLAAAFSPLPPSLSAPRTGHPGRTLRLQRPAAARDPNQVLLVVAAATRLATSRAEATTLLDLFALPPLSHRWALPERTELATLFAAAGIRWGLDGQHRATQGLPGVTRNTMARGLDRLLAGLALPPDSLALPISGAEAVASPQLELIGNLTELYSRLRRHGQDATPATMAQWVDRSLRLITDVTGLPHDEEWVAEEAISRLVALGREAANSPVLLTAAEFAHVVDELAAQPLGRPLVGGGNLTVAAPGDLPGVGFTVVALLGLEDPTPSATADAPEPATLPDERTVRLRHLERLARAAEHLVVIHQGHHEITGEPVEEPTVLHWLGRQLGVPVEPVPCSATAHAESNFTGPRPSFDAAGLAAAQALRMKGERRSSCASRRHAALHLPELPTSPEITIDEVVRFLKDPAAAFLRERAAIRHVSGDVPQDELPLRADGLDAWAIRSRLLTAARNGVPPWDAALAERRRELLPDGALGRGVLEVELELIGALWVQARNDWEQPTADHVVDLQVGTVRLVGQVRVRGDRIVHLTPSRLPGPLFEPWVQLLALTCSGTPLTARVHHLHQDFGRYRPTSVTLTPPEDPQGVLEHLVRGAVLARSRLIPVPPAPARELVLGIRQGRFGPEAWARPVDHWDSPWAWRAAHWEHFYDGPAAQLLVEPPQPEDPPGEDRFGSFGRWAFAIHAPLLEATR